MRVDMSTFPDPLLEGYKAFRSNRYASERDRYQTLAAVGQRPETMMIACCDSRAAPETVFDAMPGEIFVVRNVANMVPPYEPDGSYHSTSAALEFEKAQAAMEQYFDNYPGIAIERKELKNAIDLFFL